MLRGLADAGAEVRVLCAWRPENDGGFELAPRIKVEPILRLRGYFPDPWEVPPHMIQQTAETIRPALEWADAVYLHADTFYLRRLLPEGRPAAKSQLQSLVLYPESAHSRTNPVFCPIARIAGL